MPEHYHGGHSGIVASVSAIWVILLLLFPLTNKHRLRIGDLLAGTRVVVAPPRRLLPDMAEDTAGKKSQNRRVDEPSFTDRELSIYGIKELEVLEEVLRKAKEHGGKETTAAVMESIQKRIDWQDTRKWDPVTFLRAFYRVQRKHLEDKLLLGQRREHKVAAAVEAKGRDQANKPSPKRGHR